MAMATKRAGAGEAPPAQPRRPHERPGHREARPQPAGGGQRFEPIGEPFPDPVEYGIGHRRGLAEHPPEYGHEVVDMERLTDLRRGPARPLQPGGQFTEVGFEHPVAPHGLEHDVGCLTEPRQRGQRFALHGRQHVGGVLHPVVVPTSGRYTCQQ